MFPISITWPTALIEAVIVAVYVLLACLVTIDALLKKSDVRAALGWIATAWLSPIFGSLLYYMFGINRVTRRALKLRRQDESQARRAAHATEPVASANIVTLAKVGQKLTESPLIAGNRI